ncbi:Nudix hydrolase 8 [Acorus gramineus]|uniref:Nudix hydrolase 8 n=1 Tax=Acorus gramineus TaxID=55184 RepID=A0AAV9APH1_ACOGR|nr:Nudix hydrolase 8 [Acorus gramineus]
MCLKFPASNTKIFLRNSHAYADKLVVNVATPKTSLNGMVDILENYEDMYDGVIIDPESLTSNTTAFSAALRSSLSYWKVKGKKGVWLKILLDKVDLVPIAIKEGFVYHHTEPHYVMLTYWIPEGPCMLPAGASHQIGVGGFVINDNGEVLVVKERKCPLSCSGIWKLPTGFIDKSEEIFSGAIREVKEETGIDTTFSEVLAFRHAHHVTFEKSDLFFICMLRPLSFDITIDEAEIQAAKWMPLHEFMEQPFYKEDQMMKRVLDVCVARCKNCYGGFSTQLVISKFDERVSHLYYGGLNNI